MSPSVDLRTATKPRQVKGWTLETETAGELVWSTRGGYGIKIELPRVSVTGVLPVPQDQASQPGHGLREVGTIHPGTNDVSEAIDIAATWMKQHPVVFDDAVRNLPGIGLRTAEYLALKQGITTVEEVKQAYDAGTLDGIVSKHYHSELETEVENQLQSDDLQVHEIM